MVEMDEAHQRRAELDELLTGTFNSILRVEERMLNTQITRGLTISEVHTIVAIGLHEKNPMSVAAARLGVTPATLNTAVNKLERAGYVERTRDDEDRRKVLLSLTVEGRKVYRVHDLFHKRMVNEAMLDLTEEEEKVLTGAMRRVKAFFDSASETER